MPHYFTAPLSQLECTKGSLELETLSTSSRIMPQAITKERYFACYTDIVTRQEIWVIEPQTTVIIRKKETIRDQFGIRHNVLLTPELAFFVKDENDINSLWEWYKHRFQKEYPQAVQMTNYVWENLGAKDRATKLIWADCPWLIPITAIGFKT